jgi:hypothetical protein
VLPISGNSWQVDWQETTRDRTGGEWVNQCICGRCWPCTWSGPRQPGTKPRSSGIRLGSTSAPIPGRRFYNGKDHYSWGFVILASTFAVTEEPGPSVAPSPPPVLAQSPPAGVIEAATPAPTPVATPASASAAPTVGQAPATASPSVEASPAAANASPVAAPTPASTFSSQLLGGKEPELDAQERAGVEITAAWRQRSYQSMVSQAGTSGSRRRAKAGSITRRFWSTTG